MSASNSIVPTPAIKVLDPRIDIAKQREYVITKGGNKVSYIAYKSNSTGNNAMQFSVIPGSRQTIVDRAMYVQATIQCTFTATLAVGNAVLLPPTTNPSGATVANSLVHPGFDAPRSFPLSRALASATLQIGNTSLSMNTGDVIDPLLRVMDKNDLRFDMCPSALDKCQRYEENAGYATAGAGANPAPQSAFGWGSNVLSTSQNFLADGQLPRGCYNLQVNNPVVNGQNITQVVSFSVMEPVMLSPLCYEKLHSGLIGLQNINLLYNFSPSASQLVWSGTPKYQWINTPVTTALAVTNTVSFNTSNAMLWVGFISPSPLMSIPPQVSYAYDEIQCYTTQNLQAIQYNGWLANSVNAGTSYPGLPVQVSTNNIQLKVVPSRILIGVRPQISQMTYHDPHAYFQINGCSINFDNNVGILSSCQAEELYNISKKNGLNYDYASWLGEYDTYVLQTDATNPLKSGTVPSGFNNFAHGSGSLLVLDPALDFGLSDSLAAGVSGSYNFQVTLNVKCINSKFSTASTAYEIFVIVVNDGSISIDVEGTGAVASQIGLISTADVLTAPLDVNVDYNELKGNGWLSSIKHFARKAIPIIKDVAPHAIEIFNKAKSHLEDTGSALIGSGVGRGVGRGGKLSKLSLKSRLS
jgi:hypothetical protein